MPAKLRVTLVKSTVSHTERTRATVRALGLHRIGDSVEIADNPKCSAWSVPCASCCAPKRTRLKRRPSETA